MSCQAQNEHHFEHNGINTDYDATNLKGPVKKVVYIKKGNPEDNQNIQHNFLIFFDLKENQARSYYKSGLIEKELGYGYRKFNKANNLYAEISWGFDRLIDTITKLHQNKDYYGLKIEYDSLDLKNKANYKPKYCLKDFIFDQNDIYKLNANKYFSNYNKEYVHIYIYKYDFDSKGRITKQKEYFESFYDCENYQDSIKKFNQSMDKYLSDKINLEHEWDYVYDNQDRIIKMIKHIRDVDNDTNYKDSIMNIINKEFYDIAYDDLNRVKEIKCYIQGMKAAKERYTKSYFYDYHPTKGYLISREEKLHPYYFYEINGGSDGGTSGYLDLNTKMYYNEYGHLIKMEFLSEDAKYDIKAFDPKMEWFSSKVFPRIYDYEYDKYNNWIKCTAYFRGSKDFKPSMVIEREITYYED